MHGREARDSRILDKQIQTLTLADECTTVRRHVNQCLLLDFPHGLVPRPHIFRNLSEALDRPVGAQDTVLELSGPQSQRHELRYQILVHHRELTC